MCYLIVKIFYIESLMDISKTFGSVHLITAYQHRLNLSTNELSVTSPHAPGLAGPAPLRD